MSKIAVFPGSFSPFTIGHLSIINQSINLFDHIIIAVGNNPNKTQKFTVRKRIEWIERIYKENEKISITSYKGLTIDFCKKNNADYIIRGLRNSSDFQYEKEISQMNYKLDNKISTIYIVAPAEVSHISSSLVREIYSNNGNIRNFIPKEINLQS